MYDILGKCHFLGKDNPKSKIVFQTKDGKIIRKHFGIKEASRNTGISCRSISRCCHDKTHQKKVRGFGWIFSGEENGTVIDKK